MTPRPRRCLLPLIAGMALYGCASGPGLVPEAKERTLPPRAVAEETLRALQEREAAVTSLQAVLDLTVRHGQTRAYRQEVVAIERPNLVRLESLGWAGLTSLVVVSDGRRLVADAPLQRLFVEGSATPENVAAVTGGLLRLSPAHLVRLLLGLPPLGVSVEKTVLYGPDGDHAYLLRGEESSFTQRLWFADDDLRLLRGELYERTSLRLRFGYAPTGDGLRSLILEEPVKQVVVEVSYRSYRLNPELPRELFRLPQPAQGAHVVNLDTGSAPSIGLP